MVCLWSALSLLNAPETCSAARLRVSARSMPHTHFRKTQSQRAPYRYGLSREFASRKSDWIDTLAKFDVKDDNLIGAPWNSLCKFKWT